MRLTLRTLLAYLNDVLTPAEAEELKHRIEDSEFASTLTQRIRHVLKRLRLNAPKVDGKGVGFDANSVAEYLDSTMLPERVIDFEKVCLESDVHLAEVAAGYEILAKVLNEHATVSDDLRTRIHGLKARASHSPVRQAATTDNGQHVAAQAGASHASPPHPPAPPVVERAKPQVPDYLKSEPATSNGVWMLIPVVLLTLVGIAFFVPPLSSYNPLINPKPIAQKPIDDTGTPVPSPDKGKNPDDKNADNDETNPTDTDPANTTPTLSKTEGDDETGGEKPSADVKPEGEGIPVDPDKAVASNDDAPPKPKTDGEGSAEKPVVKPVPMPEVSPGAELGRYISDETVLAGFNPKTMMWMRVPPRSLVVEGQQCVSLPIFRPQVAMADGAQITLVGEANVAFGRQKGTELPQVAVEQGRLLVHSNALQKVRTVFNLKGLEGTLTLESPESIAAIDVYSYLPPGVDPLESDTPASIPVVNIIGVAGTCTWERQGADAVSIPANSVHISYGGEDRRRNRVQVPAWVDAATTTVVDRDAAKLIEPLLPLDRPLNVALEELATHRKFEVRMLVARCLAMLGQFDKIVKQLSEEQYKAYWMKPDGHLDTMRKQLTRGPAVAEQIRAGLIDSRGEKDGQLLYRLLLGFNSAQLVKGDAKIGPAGGGYDEQLVNLLAHPSLDVRILAIDNLNRITGTMHLYNPLQTADKAKPRIKVWQEALDKGQIRYASEPSPLTEFKSLEIKADEPPGKAK